MSLHGPCSADDDASSIYSRPPHTPKLAQPSASPTPHDLPDIQPLDHQIYLARGSTIALETTRARLQCAKANRRLSLPETIVEKKRQWQCQDHENRFFETCLEILEDLSAVAVDVSQDLILQYEFEPETSPEGNARVRRANQRLRSALQQALEREARAEFEWKRQWNVPRIGGPSVRWV
ncbi:uncharacterized protein LDX57_007846 [Aspergillus melleus]|uniref:uncharacterized protein n=1 Tax=Aspergillus melleus TaxID=138277 RepID=UPI001E8DD8AC|nr:uncharacterized protein LDX57_007846 [Aspergillus melleus]KAH8430176.1 hypothetical protein LDX57_007846 [Aspergillus melleus]